MKAPKSVYIFRTDVPSGEDDLDPAWNQTDAPCATRAAIASTLDLRGRQLCLVQLGYNVVAGFNFSLPIQGAFHSKLNTHYN